jgi:hypothetical protein
MATDPICGMTVDEQTARSTMGKRCQPPKLETLASCPGFVAGTVSGPVSPGHAAPRATQGIGLRPVDRSPPVNRLWMCR